MEITDAQARAVFRDQFEVKVVPRPRGVHPITRRASPKGRNVQCWDCYSAAKAEHQAGRTRNAPSAIVWFTNESGAPAQRAAEIAAGRHLIAVHGASAT